MDFRKADILLIWGQVGPPGVSPATSKAINRKPWGNAVVKIFQLKLEGLRMFVYVRYSFDRWFKLKEDNGALRFGMWSNGYGISYRSHIDCE